MAAVASRRSRHSGRIELGRRCGQVRSADEMTRRVLQAIAGAAHGGAETFFTRLAAALQRAREPPRVLIRPHSSPAQSLRAAGGGVRALPFRRLLSLAARFAFGPDVPAWLPPTEGFDLLLEALAAPREVALWIAGDGPLRPRLERLATRLGISGRVRFLGWREDVPRLLAAADLLVCPSLHEPLGNVVIEAWSAGLPVVATASDGPAGLIQDGESGILVPLPGVRGC